jgi:signal transduction histidine kinase
VSAIDYDIDIRRFAHSRGAAVKLTAVFVTAGALWILVTDVLLYLWVKDALLIGRLETAKGWTFVAAAGLLVYVLSSHSLAAIQRCDAMRKAIIDNLSDAIVLVSPSGRVVGVNAATLSLLGMPDKKALIGMSADAFSRVFHVSNQDGSLIPPDQYAPIRSLRGEIVPPHISVVRPPGKPPIAINVTAVPVRARPDGPVEFSVTVLRDVEMLEKLERMRDEFFSTAAHALKTPVTTISLHSQLLEASEEPEGLRKVAGVIKRQCGRIEWLVRNLLMASRMRHGNLTYHMEPVDLTALVLETVRDVGVREPRLPLELELEIEGHPTVFADRERLGLVLGNLMVDGHDRFASHEPVTLRVTADNDSAKFSVHAAHVVDEEPVSAASSTEVRARFDRNVDAGLELYVSERIIEAHGSRLEQGVDGADTWRTSFELPILVESERRIQ